MFSFLVKATLCKLVKLLLNHISGSFGSMSSSSDFIKTGSIVKWRVLEKDELSIILTSMFDQSTND